MKEMIKRTAVVTLAGVMSVGMLSGCGSKTLDGTKTVATVDGTDIPLGVVSLYAREQQQQTTTMYLNYMGSADNIWDQTADEDSGEDPGINGNYTGDGSRTADTGRSSACLSGFLRGTGSDGTQPDL